MALRLIRVCSLLCVFGAPGVAAAQQAGADLIVRNAKVTTLVASGPGAEAFAVSNGLFSAVGAESDVMKLRAPSTLVVDAAGRRVIPGLNDSHSHVVRGGRFYNLELRWDGVDSLDRGLRMIREQAERTPDGQWVRVIGGWSPYQFRERRMPTAAELSDAAPDTPVLVLFLYSRAFLNAAGVRALGLSAESPVPDGGRIEVTADGGAILHAEPSPAILYTTIGRLPNLSAEDQLNSTRHFLRELNRFGLTSAIDAGGGGHVYPDDYAATRALADDAQFPLRISNYLFAQRTGAEVAEFERWTAEERLNLNLAAHRLNGYMIEGGGENLVWSAGDYENFLAARPELKTAMERELSGVVHLLASHGWPIRIHATYDESITRILDVFEPIFKETGYTSRWFIDHAETVGEANIARIKSMGGGVAVQHRMAFAGEFFADRYGADAASHAPPLRALLNAGVPLGAGTDATRVSSYNPWIALYWLVSGKSAGGAQIASPENRLTREEALRLFTLGSAWFSGEEDVKGRIAPGQYADFAVLSDDYFKIPDEDIRRIESVLTVVGGDVVYAADGIGVSAKALPPVSPEWSPVAYFGGYAGSVD